MVRASCRSVAVKIVGVALILVAAGCASPESAAKSLPGSSHDMAGGTGGNGGDDMAGGGGSGGGGGGGQGGGGGGGSGTVDMATAVRDMAMPVVVDMAMPVVPDLSMPACVPVLNVPSSTCGIFPQCGCAAGVNCNVENDTTGQAMCAPAGTTPDWNLCTGNGDSQCTVGRSCVDGVCSPFCLATTDCPGAYRACVQVVNASSANIPGFKVCTTYCDPTSPQSSTAPYTACGPNVNCFPASDRNPYCIGPTTASGTQNASCANAAGNGPDQTKCAPSFGCVTVGPIYGCYKFCKVGVAGECSAFSSTSCNSFGTKLYSGGQEIGFCF
jgi:hypothetical protein